MENSKSAENARGRFKARYAIVAVALVGIVLALVLLLDSGDSTTDSSTKLSSNGPEVVSADSLREAVAGEPTPIYWAGERRDAELELSRPSADRTYVRYLTGGAKAGDRRASFLTVSTYAQSNAVAALRRQGKRSDGTIISAPGNATVYFDRTNPRSVYLAYPGVPVEIEVYDPNFKRALQLVNSGQIVAVG